MLVYFMLSEKNGDIYQYHYSRETQEYDGLIEYNSVNKKIYIVTPSRIDAGSAISQSITIRDFNIVVRDDFPERRTVAHG